MNNLSVLQIGRYYTKHQLTPLIKEPNLKFVREGVYYCSNSLATLFFVDLIKKGKDERFHFNDFFEDNEFHWDSQTTQSAAHRRIVEIINKQTEVHLFVRENPKIKSKTQPFVYAGRLEYISHDPNTSNPVRMLFESIDYDYENAPTHLKNIYDWNPGDKGLNTSVKIKTKARKDNSRRTTYKKPDKTERKGLVTSRVGQGYYRQELLEKWNNTCAITGCSVVSILIASHIVPWRDSSEEDKLNPNNGILLSPDVDALFDKHLISFNDDGTLVMSKKISDFDLLNLGLDNNLKLKVNSGMIPFLTQHRKITLSL